MTKQQRAWHEGVEEGYIRAVEWFEERLTAGPFQIVRMHGIFGEDVAFADVKREALASFRRVGPRFRTTVTGRKTRAVRKMN